MKCKNCGAELNGESKFCGTCGSAVENTETVESSVEKVENNLPTDIGNTVVQDNVQPTEKTTKKPNYLFLGLGLLAIVAIVVGIVLMFNKSNSNSIEVLNKAIANLNEKGKDSATVTAKIEIETAEKTSMNFSLVSKAVKTNDNYLVQLTINKNLFLPETSMFVNLNQSNAKLYIQSALIDLMQQTSCDENIWVNYEFDFSSLGINLNELESKNIDFDFSSIIDSKHFKYVDTKNSLKHYELKIDKELIENIKVELEKTDKNLFDEIFGTIGDEELEELESIDPIIIDFYINKNDELETISIDFAKYLDSDEVTKAKISLSFSDLGNTHIEIPSEATKSTVSLEDYFTKYAITDYDYDYDFDFDIDEDL